MTHPVSTRILGRFPICVFAALFVCATGVASAQTPPPQEPPTARTPNPPEIDLNVINLPTTLSMQKYHHYFRLTHRFLRDLRRGTFGNVFENLFGLDDGAVIGFEYRFALTGNLHAGAHRSMLSKTIHTFGRYDVLRQREGLPFGLTVGVGVEGLNNLQDDHQPSVLATLSHTRGDVLALYATPAYVGNTRTADFLDDHGDDHGPLPGIDEHAHHNETVFVGLGARVRFLPTAYIAAEFTPRVYGYDPLANVWAVAVEKYTRGHTLQVCFTNAFGTTPGQLSRGGNAGQVYLGFNITRKF